MSGHCIVLSLSSNLHQVWRQPSHDCLVGSSDWSCRPISAVWQRKLTGISSTVGKKAVSTPPICAAVDVEMRFGVAGPGGAGLPLLGSGLNWAVFSCAKEIKSCPTSFCVLLTFSEACQAVFGWTVSLHRSSCDVPSSRHHFSTARIPGRSSDHFQRSLIPALAFDFPPI